MPGISESCRLMRGSSKAVRSAPELRMMNSSYCARYSEQRWSWTSWVAPRENSRPIRDEEFIFLGRRFLTEFGWYREMEKLVPKGRLLLFFSVRSVYHAQNLQF